LVGTTGDGGGILGGGGYGCGGGVTPGPVVITPPPPKPPQPPSDENGRKGPCLPIFSRGYARGGCVCSIDCCVRRVGGIGIGRFRILRRRQYEVTIKCSKGGKEFFWGIVRDGQFKEMVAKDVDKMCPGMGEALLSAVKDCRGEPITEIPRWTQCIIDCLREGHNPRECVANCLCQEAVRYIQERDPEGLARDCLERYTKYEENTCEFRCCLEYFGCLGQAWCPPRSSSGEEAYRCYRQLNRCLLDCI